MTMMDANPRPRVRKVALVGTCPSSKLLAPYADPSWEIWACGPDNAGDPGLPRITRWYELHGDLGMPGGGDFEGAYIDWLRAASARGRFTLYAQRLDLFPGAHPFEHLRLVEKFGPRFFTSTPAWMMAEAIFEGATQIGLYGLDMSSREEYLVQRPAMHHFIWLAEALHGIPVHAPMESDVLQPMPMYGYDLSTPMGRKLEVRRKETLARIAAMDAKIAKLQQDRAHLAGAVDDLDYMQSIWTGYNVPELLAPISMAEATAAPGNVVNLAKGS